jgi:PBP1b-binding outer membrane lipoprotein LpoB
MKLISTVALLLAGCSPQQETVIDGSSPEEFAKTAKQARRDLPVTDRLAFDTALRTIGGRRHAVRDPDALARTTFNGMTAAEIVADQKARGQ